MNALYTRSRSASVFFFGLIIFFSLLELAMLTFWKGKLGVYYSPVVWLIAGLGAGFAVFFFVRKDQGGEELLPQEDPNQYLRIALVLLIFVAGTFYHGLLLKAIFLKVPVDAGVSDIVPSMQHYVRRWLSGDNVYAPIDYGGWTVVPTYLPFLWMPYALPEVLGFDYRWMAYGVFLFGLSFYYIPLLRKPAPLAEVLIKAIFPFALLYFLLTDKTSDLFGMSVELLPVGLYLIMGRTIFHRSWWVVALGVLLCLLSRWAFTFWLPVYLLAFWMERGFGEAFKVGVVLAAGVLLIFVVPFVIPNWQTLSEEMKIYPRTAPARWHTEFWQPEGAKPYHLKQGISFAIYFYDFVEGEPEDRLKVNRQVHKYVCLFAAFLLMLGYLYVRGKGGDVKGYFLAGLKMYLVVFYGFFYVPFLYLYQLPLLLSIPLVMGVKLNWSTGQLVN
jgi:hypothetical protein